MSGPRTAVVVLTHDGAGHLERCLAALDDALPPRGGLETILVDNGSSDGAPEAARRRFEGLRLVRSETNVGFARGVRLGVAATGADRIVLLNDDAFVEREAVAALADALETAPAEAVAVAGLLTDEAGERVDFVDGLVTFDGHALQRGAGQPLAAVPLGRRGDPRLFPCGGLCAVKRRDFEALGGFDDDFFAYLEDVDFGWRASLAGRTTSFVPEARARHVSGATGRRLGLASRGVLFESNAFAVAYKNLGDEALAALLPAILATFHHRLVRGLAEHQAGAAVALADPFSPFPPVLPRASGPARPESHRQRLVDGLSRLAGFEPPVRPARETGPGTPLLLDDDLARMWLVAGSRIVASWPGLAAKRRAVQARRIVSDGELFARWPLHLVPTYPGDEALFASAFFRSLLPEEPRLVARSLAEVLAA